MPLPRAASWSGVWSAENACSVAASLGVGKPYLLEHLPDMDGRRFFRIAKLLLERLDKWRDSCIDVLLRTPRHY